MQKILKMIAFLLLGAFSLAALQIVMGVTGVGRVSGAPGQPDPVRSVEVGSPGGEFL